ncbi:MAG: DEAD/DEAH box helicase family protein [Caecibacter sp.]|nr:DEAD/DEAH box helicase family protein [Caecibacter sp.]
MGPAELATSDAKKISTASLSFLDKENGDLESPANKGFVKKALYEIAGEGELNGVTDKSGNPATNGYTRVKNAMFAKAYQDENLLQQFTESNEMPIKNVFTAMQNAALFIVRYNNAVKDGAAFEYPISQVIVQAAKTIMQARALARKSGSKVSDYIESNSLFPQEYQWFTNEIALMMDEFKFKPKAMGAYLTRIVRNAQLLGNPQNYTIFDVPTPTLKELVTASKGGIELDAANEKSEEPVPVGKTGPVGTSSTSTGSGKVLEGRIQEEGTGTQESVGESDETAETNQNDDGQANTSNQTEQATTVEGTRRKAQDNLEEELSETAKKYSDAVDSLQRRYDKNKDSYNPIHNKLLKLIDDVKRSKGLNKSDKKAVLDKANRLAADMKADNVERAVKVFDDAINNTVNDVNSGKLDLTKGLAKLKQIEKDATIARHAPMAAKVVKVNNSLTDDAVKMIQKRVDDATGRLNSSEGSNEDVNSTTAGMVTRTGEGDSENALGQGSIQGKTAARRSGQDIRPAGTESKEQYMGGNDVPDGSTATSGTSGDSRVQAQESADSTGSTGNTELSRSVRAGLKRVPDDEQIGNDKLVRTIEERPKHEIKPRQDEKELTAEQKERQEHIKSIRDEVPVLLPEQAEDVAIAEDRYKNGGKGMLFTNGTGTGKTFTGLGVIKRMINRGKKNVLVVAPNNGILKQWEDAAQKFFGLTIHRLKNRKDGGKGIATTTYANFRKNHAVSGTNWDLVVVDESHYLMQNEQSYHTASLDELRASTGHEDGFYRYHEDRHPELMNKLENISGKISSLDNMVRKAKRDGANTSTLEKRLATLTDKRKNIAETLEEFKAQDKIEYGNKNQSSVLFLSATPFSYIQNLDYANGYLFNYSDYGEGTKGGYNDHTGRDEFYIQNFGYKRDNQAFYKQFCPLNLFFGCSYRAGGQK